MTQPRLDVEAAREALTAYCGDHEVSRLTEALIRAVVAEALRDVFRNEDSIRAMLQVVHEEFSPSPAGDDGSATRKDAGAAPTGAGLAGSPSPAGPSTGQGLGSHPAQPTERQRADEALVILARCERLYAELQHSAQRDGTTTEAHSDIRRDWNALLAAHGVQPLPCIRAPAREGGAA